MSMFPAFSFTFVLALKPALDKHLSQRIPDLNFFKDWKMGDENRVLAPKM